MARQMDYVGALIRQHCADVANQAAAIISSQDQIDRVGGGLRFPPIDLDNALRVALIETQEVAAVLAVNTDAAALRDVADDRFRRYRTTAAREVAQQVADATDCYRF